ncbi:MAG: DNA-3-methyladenine glycosylase I [Flavobacteriaceae bacterium]|nr:DNA-3-methyladenine glycosylase I [Flavobacteriaceae bacterium]
MKQEQNKVRCAWCVGDPLYEAYHDTEWGQPKYEDPILFEMLILEGAQAGLSWITILKRRENYRAAFDDFDVEKVAQYTEKDVSRLLQNKGIVRNKLKVRSAIKNAKAFITIQQEFGSFSNYLWDFVDGKPLINRFKSIEEVPAKTAIAEKLSKDLKKRGMSFVGPVIMYAYMQSVGMVNDHTLDCFKRQ